MSEHATAAVAEPQKTVVRTDIPVQPELLPQQKCACGATAGFTGACGECGEQRLSIQRRAANPARPASASAVVDVLQTRGEELDEATRGLMESRFGHDFSHVRVHTDARAAESAREVGALAYTVGRHVVFAAGHYQPRTGAGQHLIAHELTHTMQQGDRPLAPQAKLEIGEERDELEREADNVAERVMKGALTGTAPPLQPPPPLSQSSGPLIQRATEAKEGAGVAAAAKADAAETAPKTLSLIVEDETDQLAPGQMRKSEFLAELRREVCDAADAELKRVGRDTESCPYITRAFAHYQTQDSRKVERSLRRYAPEAKAAKTAQEYIGAVSVRIARAVGVWAETGEVRDVPEELAAEMSGTGWIGGASGLAGMAEKAVGSLIGGVGKAISGLGSMLFKERAGGARTEHAQAAMMRTRFDEGQALDTSVRTRMEGAFGHDFSRVRVYADSSAAELSTKLNARAFTVGQSVGFGAGEYRPGTLVGDALIAHELAHVVQQGEAGNSSTAPLMKPEEGSTSALEEDADVAAVGAVASIWGGVKYGLVKFSKQAMPRLKSGLQLQRCQPSPEPPKTTYEKYLFEGNEKLRGIGFGLQWGDFCAQKPKDRSGDRIDGYDVRYWNKESDPISGCKLTLKENVTSADAINALFASENKKLWQVDCGQFVQLANFYATLRTLVEQTHDEKKGADAFNERVGRIELKRLHSTGLKTKILWGRDSPQTDVMVESELRPGQRYADPKKGGRTKKVEDVLEEAPIGSRVEFTQSYPILINDAYRNENTIKMGKNFFAAHPLSAGLFGTTNILTREQVLDEVAKAADNPEAARRGIYISEIEYYETP